MSGCSFPLKSSAVQHKHPHFSPPAPTPLSYVGAAVYISCLGDPITDLISNMAAEQRARTTYEHLIAATCDPHAKDVLRFLWQREVVHFQRFGEALNDVEEWMNKCKRVWTGEDAKDAPQQEQTASE